ncbi:uncharacterized protein LOC112494052 [Cephus cinctus]|uniref:Uncharacterized protein LOC112494052 n=1 Tax=Cephus cinctus TaxID=211228 RepID=A0AAJ7RD50_CEPCN|nr:uncharacterized protein LOC112494052 [Cephus cinctus]
MPTCPDTCPVVRAQILMEQEALRSAAKEKNKDTVPKRTQPIKKESRLEDSSTRANSETLKSKSSPQTQQMNNNITQQNVSTPGRSPDKKYQNRHVQQDMQSDVENISPRSSGTASRKKRREDELDDSSYVDAQEKSGAASGKVSRAIFREDKQDESSNKNIQGRSQGASSIASRAKQREDIKTTKYSDRKLQSKSGEEAATSIASHARQREDINTTKYSDRKLQSKSGTFSKEEMEEEAGPSSGGRSIPQRHSPCDPECPLKRYKELIKRRTEEKQRKLDRYLIRKGFNYFDNLCTCSVICLFNQLSRDPFVRSLIQSALLFTVGLKLCSELYAWEIPSRATFY